MGAERGIRVNEFYVLLTDINLLRPNGVGMFKSHKIEKLVKIATVLVLLLSSGSLAFELPSQSSFYVMNGSCSGGEESDPHAVHGIETEKGDFILLGKMIDASLSKRSKFKLKRDDALTEGRSLVIS